jgi:ABC-type dipeptide/oligopeptide/nickel transport system permease component
MAYVMITILFIVFFVIYRKQVKENSNIALVRTKKANKTAIKRLKQAEKLLDENKEEAFYEEILRALWGYLSDKLNMPQSKLTKDNVASELTKYGVDNELSIEFLDIINTCEFARFAPATSTGAMDKLFNETVEAIGKMENTIKK